MTPKLYDERGPIVLPARYFVDDLPYSLENDCSCPMPQVQQKTTSVAGNTLIYRPEDTVCQELDGTSFYALVNRKHDNSFAVTNTEGLSLLERFSEAARPVAIADMNSYVTCEAVQLFASLGYLESVSNSNTTTTDEMPTLIVWLSITNACNLRCVYCFVNKTEDHMSEKLGETAIQQIIETAIRHGYKRVKIKYAGGEPMIRSKQLFCLHALAVEMGNQHQLTIDGVILTNGTVMSARMISEINRLGLRVSVSLDSIDMEHDQNRPSRSGYSTVERTKDILVRLLEHGVIPSITITITENNACSLADTVDWLLNLDPQLPISFNLYRTVFGDMSLIRDLETKVIDNLLSSFCVIEGYLNRLPQRSLLNILDRSEFGHNHKRPCAAGSDYMVINFDGHVSRCHMEMHDPITHIAEPAPLFTLQSSQKGVRNPSVLEKEPCSTCDWRTWCAGGCPLETYRVTGRFDLNSPNCAIYKAIYPALLKLEAKRVLTSASIFIH